MHPDLHCSSEAHFRNKKSIKNLNPGSQESKKIENSGRQKAEVGEGSWLSREGSSRAGRGVAGWAGVWQGGEGCGRVARVRQGGQGCGRGGQGLEQQRVGTPVGDFCQCDKHPRETFCRSKCMVWLLAVEVSAWVCPLPRA